MKFLNWTPYTSQPMGGGGDSGGGGGTSASSSYTPSKPKKKTTTKSAYQQYASSLRSAKQANLSGKLSTGKQITGVQSSSENEKSDAFVSALVAPTDSRSVTYKTSDGGSSTVTTRDTKIPLGGTITTGEISKVKDSSGNLTGGTWVDTSRTDQPDSNEPTTTTTASASAPADTQSTASANVPVYDQTVEEAKVSAKRKVRRRGKRGLRVSKTAVGTGGAPASGLSIPKG